MEWMQSLNLHDFWLWASGQTGMGSNYMIARWIFLRLLGVVYLIAILSLWVQVKGLIGSNGILPVSDYLSALKANLGIDRFANAPTVFWFNSSDLMIHLVCAIGALAAVSLILGFAPMISLFVLWVCYLSLTVAGQQFLSFQWDILLLEAGFIAIFFAPTNIMPGLANETPVSPIFLFLLWFLLFRLMFESGVVKITSGDSSWINLTAFDYHYFTQPLPTWTAWFMHHLPVVFQKFSILYMYVAELLLPLFLFGPRSMRMVGAIGMAILMLVITATGNYAFFTLLTIVLCLLWFDDTFWNAVLPDQFIEWIGTPAVGSVPTILVSFSIFFGVFVLFVSSIQIASIIQADDAYSAYLLSGSFVGAIV